MSVKHSLTILKRQLELAQNDVETLNKVKSEALEDPYTFLATLKKVKTIFWVDIHFILMQTFFFGVLEIENKSAKTSKNHFCTGYRLEQVQISTRITSCTATCSFE